VGNVLFLIEILSLGLRHIFKVHIILWYFHFSGGL